MTINKSNRVKELVKELDEIEYILCNNRLEPIKRKFYEHRYSLIQTHVENYLNETNNSRTNITKTNYSFT